MAYNQELLENNKQAIVSKLDTIALTSINLSKSGYLLPSNYDYKLDLGCMIYKCFERINLLDVEQENNIDRAYSKFMMI